MKEYARRRQELGKSKEEVAAKMGVSLHKYNRIERGGGNIFEVACIRDHLQMEQSNDKRTYTLRK